MRSGSEQNQSCGGEAAQTAILSGCGGSLPIFTSDTQT